MFDTTDLKAYYDKNIFKLNRSTWKNKLICFNNPSSKDLKCVRDCVYCVNV